MPFRLGSALSGANGWKTYDTNLIDTSKLPTKMASYEAGGKFTPAEMGGGGGGAAGNVMGSVAQFAADLIEANGMAKAGGALASAQARQGLGRMAEDKLNLGGPKRLGYWLR